MALLTLPNGCSFSEIKVTPSNWDKRTGSTADLWRIHYRFYDPKFPKPYQVIIKSGINKTKDLAERRFIVKKLIANEYEKLQKRLFNPRTNVEMIPSDLPLLIEPDTPFIEALRASLAKINIGKETRDDIGYCINGIQKSAVRLGLDIYPISSISRKHIKLVLEDCGKNNPRWSAGRYNTYRAYLLMLFKELVEQETVVANPIRDISKMKTFKKLRMVLSDEQRVVIDAYLKEKDYRFWLFMNLFFHSGGRKTELVQLQAKHVDLKNQVYTSITKKGKESRQINRTIKNIAVPFWEEFLKDCKPDEFLFGIDFLPADKPIVPDTITRRWQKLVKRDLGIAIDFYSLKHLNSTETVDQIGDKAAAEQNGHTTPHMVNTVYDIRKDKRQHELLKQMKNRFA